MRLFSSEILLVLIGIVLGASKIQATDENNYPTPNNDDSESIDARKGPDSGSGPGLPVTGGGGMPGTGTGGGGMPGTGGGGTGTGIGGTGGTGTGIGGTGVGGTGGTGGMPGTGTGGGGMPGTGGGGTGTGVGGTGGMPGTGTGGGGMPGTGGGGTGTGIGGTGVGGGTGTGIGGTGVGGNINPGGGPAQPISTGDPSKEVFTCTLDYGGVGGSCVSGGQSCSEAQAQVCCSGRCRKIKGMLGQRTCVCKKKTGQRCMADEDCRKGPCPSPKKCVASVQVPTEKTCQCNF